MRIPPDIPCRARKTYSTGNHTDECCSTLKGENIMRILAAPRVLFIVSACVTLGETPEIHLSGY
jgi:hypothetical protein